MAVACTEPDERGIVPVVAIPKLLERFELKMDDIGLWELNEAFAVQVLYCRDKLGIPNELLNVNGGAISIAAINSMRLFVGSGSPPDKVFTTSPQRRQSPQPPAPGLPLHAPSVRPLPAFPVLPVMPTPTDAQG